MNRTALSLAIVGLAFVAEPAAHAQQRNVHIEQGVTEPAAQPDQTLLARMVPSVDVVHGTFLHAIDDLRDATRAKIFVNWKSLEEVHVDRSDEVTFSAKNVPLDDALRMLLQIASKGRDDLAFTIEGNAIVIDTVEQVRWASLQTCVYDIRDLLGATSGQQRQERVARIMDLLTDDIDPASWAMNDSRRHGKIKELEGQLIVTQTPENQQAIIRMLNHLKMAFRGNLESAPNLIPATLPSR